MSESTRTALRGLLPEIFEWLDGPRPSRRPFGPGPRLEEYREDGDYDQGVLTIRVAVEADPPSSRRIEIERPAPDSTSG